MIASSQEPRTTSSSHGTSQSDTYHRSARRSIAGGANSNVRLAGTPLCFVKGQGSHLLDLDGNTYIDYALGMGPTILGHAPPSVIEAVTQSLGIGQLFAGQHPLELELAELFKRYLPNVELVRFGLSGSEMVQAALRVARAFTKRPLVIKFEGHYHGWFDNILVNHTSPPAAQEGPFPIPRYLQSEGQSPSASADMVVLPWNDLSALTQYLEQNADQVAAVIMEPIMLNTGAILPRPGYLQGVRELATRHRIVLIFDEVITGFRVALGGAQSTFGVHADLSIYAKAFGAGFPIAALGGREDIMSLFGTGRVNHSGTYNANLVSLSAALATLKELSAPASSAYARIESVGRRLIDGLRGMASRHGVAMQVSGLPAAFHTAFVQQPIETYWGYKLSDPSRLSGFLNALLTQGVRPTSRGTWFVSATHTDDDVDRTLAAADRALHAAEDA